MGSDYKWIQGFFVVLVMEMLKKIKLCQWLLNYEHLLKSIEPYI